MEDVNAHFVDETSWGWTGSWDDHDSYTEGNGPWWGDVANPASLHPKVYSIKGGNFTGTEGVLTIISGVGRGWVLASFSGVTVLSCTVTSAAGKSLPGTWNQRTQQFTPSERDPTVDATWTLTITVPEGNTEWVNTHFLDVPLPPDTWCYTGSWDASDSCTEGWGPDWCAVERPASAHPTIHSIHGSNNTGEYGTLSILSAPARGWVMVSFSGAHVLNVDVQCGCPETPSWVNHKDPPTKQGDHLTRHLPLASGALVESMDPSPEKLMPSPDSKSPEFSRPWPLGCTPMAGEWSPEEQEWTPDTRGPTVDATCTVDVTVARNTTDCVNAHFVDRSGGMAPPTKPERDDPEDEGEDKPRVGGGHYPPPPPPPDTWDHVADADNEEEGEDGGARPPKPPAGWRWTGSWDGPDSYTIGWGPPWGKDENAATLHPDGYLIPYSITGSNNTGTTGFLSIISGTERGWILASFSGAEVLTCSVKNIAGKTLPGTWSFVRQQFTPDERLPTVDTTWTLSITVAHGNLEDVNTHFIDELPGLPEPDAGWRYTGSWDASDSYTEGWGPEWGVDEHPASLHPAVHSIHGSNNTGEYGSLSILSATTRGWILVSFSGAHVLNVHVRCGCPMLLA